MRKCPVGPIVPHEHPGAISELRLDELPGRLVHRLGFERVRESQKCHLDGAADLRIPHFLQKELHSHHGGTAAKVTPSLLRALRGADDFFRLRLKARQERLSSTADSSNGLADGFALDVRPVGTYTDHLDPRR